MARFAGDRLAFPPDLIQALVASAERILSNRLLTRYAWFCHIAITDPNLAETVMALPAPNDDSLFFALILLSALPSLTDYYQTRNISIKIGISFFVWCNSYWCFPYCYCLWIYNS